MSDVCATCTEEEVNESYTINSGIVYVCAHYGGATEHSLGEVGVVRFTYRPNYAEHYRGRDGQFDAALPIRTDFELEVEIHEITPFNLATAMGVSWVPTAGGCKIPFKKPNCGRHYGVRFEHQFPCANKYLYIHMWAALVMAEFSLEFGESIINFPITFRATPCASSHPTEEFGNIELQTTCPAS